jgi:hypothetical protein
MWHGNPLLCNDCEINNYSTEVSLVHERHTQRNTVLQYHTPQARSPVWLLKLASEHAHARLLPRLPWSWTVLLPSDKNRKPITFITAVFLSFVTYLLTLPRIIHMIYEPQICNIYVWSDCAESEIVMFYIRQWNLEAMVPDIRWTVITFLWQE